jgi:hypothetical protein
VAESYEQFDEAHAATALDDLSASDERDVAVSLEQPGESHAVASPDEAAGEPYAAVSNRLAEDLFAAAAALGGPDERYVAATPYEEDGESQAATSTDRVDAVPFAIVSHRLDQDLSAAVAALCESRVPGEEADASYEQDEEFEALIAPEAANDEPYVVAEADAEAEAIEGAEAPYEDDGEPYSVESGCDEGDYEERPIAA